jgi:hypothetical protein
VGRLANVVFLAIVVAGGRGLFFEVCARVGKKRKKRKKLCAYNQLFFNLQTKSNGHAAIT